MVGAEGVWKWKANTEKSKAVIEQLGEETGQSGGIESRAHRLLL